MRVLLLDSWTAEAEAALAKVCDVVTFAAYPGKLTGFDGLVAGINVPLPSLSDMPNLRFVATAATGLDHIDLDYCKSHDIRVLSLQNETEFLRDVHATAEHTMALILSLIRKVPFAHNDVCAGHWDRERFQGSELHGKRIGVVGLGRVGHQVFYTLLYMGGDMMYTDPRCVVCLMPGNESSVWTSTLDEVLQQSDIVTVHVPLDDSTRGMFGALQFATMKPTAYFINTSRGAVVDEAALLCALNEGTIAGAALDVLCDEPLVNYKLVDYARLHDNLILTCHIAGNTRESRLKTQLFLCDKIREFIGGASHALDAGFQH